MPRKQKATIAAITGTAVILLGLWLIVRTIGRPEGKPLNTLAPFGQQSQDIQDLVIPVFSVAGVIFVLVMVAVIWMVVRFREPDGAVEGQDEPAQTHGNTPLEIGWTIVPAVILAVLAVLNVQTLLKLDDTGDSPMEVTVVGQQWWWEYRYDMDGDQAPEIITATQMVMPTDTDVVVKIQSNDVIHSFWIPSLNGKKDAVPGRTHSLVFNTSNPGIYEGQCTEFCGLSHGVMRMQIKALPEAEFASWVENMTTPPAQPSTAAAERGQELFVGQCARCHEVNGLTPESTPPFSYSEQPSASYGVEVDSSLSSKNAPNLTNFMMRQTFAGNLLALWEGDAATAVTAVPGSVPGAKPDKVNIKRWLRNPQDVKPMDAENNQGMPNLNLSEDQIDDLTEYLVTLGPSTTPPA
jgi:cytochrome c oxidase subunit 2